MAKTAWPTGDELYDYLVKCRFVDDSDEGLLALDYANEVEAARMEFERFTRWEPFLATGSTTLKFSPEDIQNAPNSLPFLDFDGGVVSVTSLTVGVTPNSSGTALTQDTHYFLRPARAASKGKPFTYLEFYNPAVTVAAYSLGGYPDSIRLVCSRGYATTVPEDVWNAVLKLAAQNALTGLSAAVSGGLVSWKSADVEEKYAEGGPFQKQSELFAQQAKSVMMRYRRLSL